MYSILPSIVSRGLHLPQPQMSQMREQIVNIWRNVIPQYTMSHSMMSTFFFQLIYSAYFILANPHPSSIRLIYTGSVEPYSISFLCKSDIQVIETLLIYLFTR